MPVKGKRLCSHAGCVTPTTDRYCEKHIADADYWKNQRKQEKRKEDKEPRAYANSRWRKARLTFLNTHPLCEICEACGRTEPAVDVHHKVHFLKMIDGKRVIDSNIFWDTSQWQALCKKCHGDVEYGKVETPAYQDGIRTVCNY